jgi:hypothetical protein
MESTAENIKLVCSKIEELGFLFGAPKTAPEMRAIAKAICRLVRNETIDHEMLGKVNDLDWLVERITEGCSRFPTPIVMRKIYCAYFTAADGRQPSDVEAEES